MCASSNCLVARNQLWQSGILKPTQAEAEAEEEAAAAAAAAGEEEEEEEEE